MDNKRIERLHDFITLCEDILYLVQWALAKGAILESRATGKPLTEVRRTHESEHVLENNESIQWRKKMEMELRLKEMSKQGLKTNDIVVVIGNQWGRGARQLLINGLAPIKIDRREYLVLYVLAKVRSEGGGFISVDQLIESIIEINKEANARDGITEEEKMFWPIPEQNELYTAICKIRAKLKDNGHTGDLIENGAGERGYRLSTAAANIFLVSRHAYAGALKSAM